jgi:hypothetical protein
MVQRVREREYGGLGFRGILKEEGLSLAFLHTSIQPFFHTMAVGGRAAHAQVFLGLVRDRPGGGEQRRSDACHVLMEKRRGGRQVWMSGCSRL